MIVAQKYFFPPHNLTTDYSSKSTSVFIYDAWLSGSLRLPLFICILRLCQLISPRSCAVLRKVTFRGDLFLSNPCCLQSKKKAYICELHRAHVTVWKRDNCSRTDSCQVGNRRESERREVWRKKMMEESQQSAMSTPPALSCARDFCGHLLSGKTLSNAPREVIMKHIN